MKAGRRAPSLLFVLAAHGLLLGALLQLAPTTGTALPGLPQVAWLSLSRPLPQLKPPPITVAQTARAPARTAAAIDRPAPVQATAPLPETTLAAAEVNLPSPVPAAPPPAPPAPPAAVVAAAHPAPMPEPITTRPDHTHCQPPPYPPPLRERGIEGAVQLRVQVDAHGRAAAVLLQATSGWRLFDEAALAQARACRFQPARRNGVAVDSWVEFPMRFALTTS